MTREYVYSCCLHTIFPYMQDRQQLIWGEKSRKKLAEAFWDIIFDASSKQYDLVRPYLKEDLALRTLIQASWGRILDYCTAFEEVEADSAMMLKLPGLKIPDLICRSKDTITVTEVKTFTHDLAKARNTRDAMGQALPIIDLFAKLYGQRFQYQAKVLLFDARAYMHPDIEEKDLFEMQANDFVPQIIPLA